MRTITLELVWGRWVLGPLIGLSYQNKFWFGISLELNGKMF
jgi:hypothetical protein